MAFADEYKETAGEAIPIDREAFVDQYPHDAFIVRLNLAVAFGALGVGGLFGLIQALHRTGIYRGFVSSATAGSS